MNCPHCNKEIYGLTGLQEVLKFQKHLRTCKKNPKHKVIITPDGNLKEIKDNPSMMTALNLRVKSGQ